jgi:RNA polymerase sigma-70 factor (ECF subfamily)
MAFHPNETPLSDENLMLRFSKGSRDGFAELFQRHKQPILGYFCRRVVERPLAEELTQETFLALYRAGSRYEPRALFRTYLYAIAMRILQAHRRKASFRQLFWGSPKAASEASARDSTESNFWVRQAVGKLSAADREVLLLREFEQLSYAEISDLLKLPLNTVRSRLFRARMALRDLLEPAKNIASAEQDAAILAENGEQI